MKSDRPIPDLRSALVAAIAANPHRAADALVAIQLGYLEEERINLAGIGQAAKLVGRQNQIEQFLLEQLDARRLTRPFALALVAREQEFPANWQAALADLPAPASETDSPEPTAPTGEAALDAAIEPDVDEGGDGGEGGAEADPIAVNLQRLQDANAKRIGPFEDRARALRCRIYIDQQFKGSGFLVGPSTVMTAWHVIASVVDATPPPRLEIAFTDGQRIPALLPPRDFSRCSDKELAGEAPKTDAEVADLHDVALLTLRRPAGASIGVAELATSPRLRTNAAIFVGHFPEGNDLGLGIGILQKMHGLNNRWSHSVATSAGSSGAGCFDTSYQIAGVHQGKAQKPYTSRLVPSTRIPQSFRDKIADDVAAPDLWSLDGTVEGKLVIGRQGFFDAFAAASRPDTRVRGIRIKRADAAADESGIPFSYEMLEQMVVRSVNTLALRVSFDVVVKDLADEVVRRAGEAGVGLAAIGTIAGVGIGDTSPIAVAADRGRRAALALDAALTTRGQRLWIFLEHPSAVFDDVLRAGFDGFVDQALRAPSLRLVVAGYEAVSLPGVEFETRATADAAAAEGAPGFVVEYIAGFTRADVEALFRKAAKALGDDPVAAVVEMRAGDALNGIIGINDVYPTQAAKDVAIKLRDPLRRLAEKAGLQPPVVDEGEGHG